MSGPTNINLPELSLVVLIGASGSGKSTFAARVFRPTEVVSSDRCRGLVRDDENDPAATDDAFELLHFVVRKRLAAGKLTVVDATNVQPEARRPLLALAREHHVLPVAIVLDLPERVLLERAAGRTDRKIGAHVVRHQQRELRRSRRVLEKEGFRRTFFLGSEEEVAAVEVTRERLWNDRRDDRGPFDVIGDVHGCRAELEALLDRLGYAPDDAAGRRHPEGRKAVFLGDLVDRGPDVPGVMRLVMKMVRGGTALSVPGNHEVKLARKLVQRGRGKEITMTHGLAASIEQLDREPPELRAELVDFIDGLVSHYVLDDGRLVVAHAGMKASMMGRASGAVREFALYGDTTGETDELGLPIRHPWAVDYRGKPAVVYGHTPVLEAEWLNNTVCIDTGCVYGGRLTALRWPERQLVSVPAERVWCEPVRPLARTSGLDGHPPSLEQSAQHVVDDLLDADDVLGKRKITTAWSRSVIIREENALAALEAMSRFATNPKWLIYLPPTMSPSETSPEPGWLEHPREAFAYYRRQGVEHAVVEEKHMGSRAVVIVAKSEAAARARFGVEGEAGAIYTRTGRRFFTEPELELGLLDRVRRAAERAGLFDELATDWLCLDAELMPWSLKAQDLVRAQYAAVGAASRAEVSRAAGLLEQARGRAAALDPESGARLEALSERTKDRAILVGRFAEAYRRYIWPVHGVDDLRLAPFHLLASEGHVHHDRDHLWHMETLARLAAEDPGVLVATPHRRVDLASEAEEAEATAWWEALVGRGGEGMVVKPLAYAPKGKQPALKCRGPEYLRIIYGPEYTRPENLARLKQRGLAAKRSLALRELALGLESLERFVRREPLRRVHECVFGVLALESEPVDPRL